MEEQRVRQTKGHLVKRQLLLAYARGLAGKAQRAKKSLNEASGLDALICWLRLNCHQRALTRSIRELEELVDPSDLKTKELLEIAEMFLRAGLGLQGLPYVKRVQDPKLNPSADHLALASMVEGQIWAAEGNLLEADQCFEWVIKQFRAVPEMVSLSTQARVHRARAEFLRKTRTPHLARQHEEKAQLIEIELGAAGIGVEQETY